jgi:predicted nuclease of predicted toxin-antitoxin system
MRQGQIVDLTEEIPLLAADLALETKLPMADLPMADSIILTAARLNNTHIWTQDADFEGLDDVTFITKV